MKQIALFAAAAFVSVSVAGCAVEVPMSAFQLGPLGAEQSPDAQTKPNPAPEPSR